ncbi:MAG: YceI family protein [Chitinophagaceae bacterium]|nr:YceI family protein [Chitinophagaceae bacterium]
MKKIIFLFLFTAIQHQVFAQEKIYSTKSGTISFYSSTPLEKIEAFNRQVTCKLSSSSGQIVFLLLIKGFTFDNALMQEHFNENYMESSKFPKADFKGVITNINEVDFTKNGSYNVFVEGNLTIHGITKKITSKGSLVVNNGKVSANSKLLIKVKDFGITGKYIGEKIANEIETTISCNFD